MPVARSPPSNQPNNNAHCDDGSEEATDGRKVCHRWNGARITKRLSRWETRFVGGYQITILRQQGFKGRKLKRPEHDRLREVWICVDDNKGWPAAESLRKKRPNRSLLASVRNRPHRKR